MRIMVVKMMEIVVVLFVKTLEEVRERGEDDGSGSDGDGSSVVCGEVWRTGNRCGSVEEKKM